MEQRGNARQVCMGKANSELLAVSRKQPTPGGQSLQDQQGPDVKASENTNIERINTEAPAKEQE